MFLYWRDKSLQFESRFFFFFFSLPTSLIILPTDGDFNERHSDRRGSGRRSRHSGAGVVAVPTGAPTLLRLRTEEEQQ